MPGTISVRNKMRFRIPGRVIAFGVLLALLCLLPASTHIASAKPIGWDNPNNLPPPPNGDNDGVVVKAARIPTNSVMTSSGSTSGTAPRWSIIRSGFSGFRGFAALVRLEYWWLIVR